MSNPEPVLASPDTNGETFGPSAALIGKRLGNFVVERPLARGGMGAVYVARHPSLNREVAVKFLDAPVSGRGELSERFLSEAQVTAGLRHPNIVDILDFGEIDGRLYYVMELLKGKSLRSYVEEHQRLSVADTLNIIHQVLSALEAAHSAGVVHRDLKPENVIVLEGSPLRIKLVDFGVAKVLTSTGGHTQNGQVVGTPTHMAPEQAMGNISLITPKSDLYALGVIAYELLTGSLPFEHESDFMLLIMHVRDPVPSVRAKEPRVPAGIASLVERCLSKDPNARPASAAELGELLRKALSEPEALPTAEVVETSLPVDPSNDSGPELERQRPRHQRQEAATVRMEQPHLGNAERTLAPAAEPARSFKANVQIEPRVERAPKIALKPTTTAGHLRTVSPKAPEPRGSARDTLSKLTNRLQRKGDFPAFAQSIGEVSVKADARSVYSAGQLGESILKDYALTAKLLRVINSMYAGKFGGKIYSIKHAIVLLGFDRIRSLALGISLFKSAGKDAQARRVSDSAISSIIAGEIARFLSGDADANDEEAMVAAMFRNLGRHLVVVYLPELFEQIVGAQESDNIDEKAAAERVLGISFYRIGSAIAEDWHLPEGVQHSVAGRSSLEGALLTAEDRALALAEFANDLCEVIGNSNALGREQAINELIARYRRLLRLDERRIVRLLADVESVFQERYASILGLDAKASSILTNVASMVHGDAPVLSEHAALANELRPEEDQARAHPQPAAGARTREAPRVTKLELGKAPSAAQQPLEAGIEAVALEVAALAQRLAAGATEEVLLGGLTLFCRRLGLSRALVLIPTASKDELVVRSGVHEDLDVLAKDFRVNIKSRQTNVFQTAFMSLKDVEVPDAFSRASGLTVPQLYYELIGSRSLGLYVCGGKGRPHALLFVDTDMADRLPQRSQLAELGELRALLAQAAYHGAAR